MKRKEIIQEIQERSWILASKKITRLFSPEKEIGSQGFEKKSERMQTPNVYSSLERVSPRNMNNKIGIGLKLVIADPGKVGIQLKLKLAIFIQDIALALVEFLLISRESLKKQL